MWLEERCPGPGPTLYLLALTYHWSVSLHQLRLRSRSLDIHVAWGMMIPLFIVDARTPMHVAIMSSLQNDRVSPTGSMTDGGKSCLSLPHRKYDIDWWLNFSQAVTWLCIHILANGFKWLPLAAQHTAAYCRLQSKWKAFAVSHLPWA